jgi:cyclophilin family peptidyl-prolyl cis-trans isomerase
LNGESSLIISRRKLVWTSVVQVGTSITTGVVASTILFSQPEPAVAAYIDPAISPPTITDKVYLDVEFVSNDSIKKKSGRIVLGLYGQTMPKTVQNFVTLCSTNAYAGTTFYRIISEYSIQGGAIGDVTRSGKSGQSSLENGSTFEPDNFNIKHSTKGLVSMVKAQQSGSGVDSRFFIQLQDDAGWADDRYAAFGIVMDGMEMVDAIKTVAVQPPKNNPKQDVIIVASGVL